MDEPGIELCTSSQRPLSPMQRCAGRCRSLQFRFAGLRAVLCVCSDGYQRYGAHTDCDTSPDTCSGDLNERCGSGTNRLRVLELRDSPWTGHGLGKYNCLHLGEFRTEVG